MGWQGGYHIGRVGDALLRERAAASVEDEVRRADPLSVNRTASGER